MSSAINAFGANLQQYIGSYQQPIMIIGGIVVAVWLVLMYRALQAYNGSESAQLERALKHK